MGRWSLLKSKKDISLFMRVARYAILIALVFPWSLLIGGVLLGKCL